MILWSWALINNEDEAAYLHEVERITSWCQDKLSLSEREQNQRADRGLQEETVVISGTPVERVSSFKYLVVKHLRGPDMDYTHSKLRLRKARQKTYPSATAEEIQGLSSYPENFLFRGHRKCSDSVHLSVVW